MKKIILSLILAIVSTSVFAAGKKITFSVMTYNLENLFDTEHDAGKEDWTYMSLEAKRNNPAALEYCHSLTNEYYKKSCLELDWNQKVVDEKIKNLSKAITEYKGGADILVFQEVENIKILRELARKGLARRGYRYISLIEGPDTRGIDVGIISRYPIVSEKYHHISMKPFSDRFTRGVLETTLKINNKTVTIMANHWPSQRNDDGTRLLASEVLKKAALKSKSDVVIATGDFNTLSSDKPHGINRNILPIFEDIEIGARSRKYNVGSKGTHWYKGKWSSIDKMFVLKKSIKSKKVKVDYSSFKIINERFMTNDFIWTNRDTGEQINATNVPNRFNTTTMTGFSDHLPVGVSLEI